MKIQCALKFNENFVHRTIPQWKCRLKRCHTPVNSSANTPSPIKPWVTFWLMYFFDSLWYAWWFLWHFCRRTFWYSELFQRGWSPSLDMYLVRWLVGTGLWWYVVAVMAVQFWPHLVVQMGVEEQLTQNWCRLIQMCEETIVFKAYTWQPVVSGWCKILLRSEPLAKLQLAKRVKSQWCDQITQVVFKLTCGQKLVTLWLFVGYQ